MKAHKLFFILAFIFSGCLIACDDEPVDPALLVGNNNNNPTVNTGTMTALVDGDLYTATGVSATYSALAGGAGNLLTITGVKTSGESITLQMANPLPGTYTGNNNTAPETTVNLSYKATAAGPLFTAYDFLQSQPTGILKITKFDPVNRKVSGTFTFIGYLSTAAFPLVQINNGVFTDVLYTLQ